MRRQGLGLIVNLSPVAGKVSMPFAGLYSATKHAVEALSDALRLEVKLFGIRVILIEPGTIKTGFDGITLGELRRIRDALVEHGALVGASDHGSTKALYAHDPDGIEFEVSWLVPADRLGQDTGLRTAPLDLDAEIARYGADLRGGLGVSVPAAATG